MNLINCETTRHLCVLASKIITLWHYITREHSVFVMTKHQRTNSFKLVPFAHF